VASWAVLHRPDLRRGPAIGSARGARESQLVLAHATVTGNPSHNHHYDGDADGAIQHHELQDLNGAPACLVAACELPLAHVGITVYVSDALTEGNPFLLERPPKYPLSV
jgi:hypothetical protein